MVFFDSNVACAGVDEFLLAPVEKVLTMEGLHTKNGGAVEHYCLLNSTL